MKVAIASLVKIFNSVAAAQRRRIKTEGKVKVLASVWREEFLKFHAPAAVLHWTI